MIVNIVPNSSIGRLELGMRRDQLPQEAVVQNDRGTLDNISFRLTNDAIVDVWINDIRSFPHTLHFNGKLLDPATKVAQLKLLMGPCEQRHGIIGGIFFNCAGTTIGLDINQSEKPVQIRMRRR